MEKNIQLIIVWIFIWGIIAYLVAKVFFWTRIRWQRKNAVERSKNVLIGQVNEKIAPMLPGFPYNYKDLVFIGKWVDYIIFNWLSTGNLKEIIFLEIKSWTSQLNRNENMIKDCINDKKISYEIMRIKN